MKNKNFGYIDDWRNSPMAYWVHIETDTNPWSKSEIFVPPAPVKHGNLGYSTLTIEIRWI